jgi:hypothetical protein
MYLGSPQLRLRSSSAVPAEPAGLPAVPAATTSCRGFGSYGVASTAPRHPHPRLGSNLYPFQNRYQTRTAELRPRNYDFVVARQSLPSRRACPPSPKLRLHVVVSEVMARLAPTRATPIRVSAAICTRPKIGNRPGLPSYVPATTTS